MSFPKVFPRYFPSSPLYEGFDKFFGSSSRFPFPARAGGEKIPMDMPGMELDRIRARDFDTIRLSREKVIAGYLNLGKADGWEEGHDSRVGAIFARFILFQYFFQNKGHLGSNAVVFENVLQAMKGCQGLIEGVDSRPHLDKSRICYDSSVEGWQNHAVSRLVGNVGSVYLSSKPFFEILVNSARNSSDDDLRKPFFISVYANEEEIEKRRSVLRSLNSMPGELASVRFYSSGLTKPEDFLKTHQKKLGRNSTRLMTGLIYLQNVTLPAQKVGNCWIKQPMRCLLASLYVELITNRPDLLPAAAWAEAKELYKRIQRDVAIPLVEDMIKESDVTPEMKRTALLGVEKQKQL